MLTVGSLFAGIGGFDLGFERAGFKTVWQVEIDEKCRRVLENGFPDVKRFADIRTTGAANLERVGVICGGFPCQDLSHCRNGRRAGLAGIRSGLFFEMARIVKELQPRWVVCENVTGLLSQNQGRDFETVLGTLDELGYGVAWRVLNSAYFGIAQKRRRVFVVASLGTDSAGAVLFADVGQDLASISAEAPPEGVEPVVIKTHNTGGNGVGISRYAHTFDSRPDRVVLAPFDRNRVGSADGVPEKLDAVRHKQIGNAVVPQISQWIAERIKQVISEFPAEPSTDTASSGVE